MFGTSSFDQLPGGLTTFRDVSLTTASGDLLAPWIDQFNTSSADATALLNNFFEAPGVALQQFVANESGFVQDLLTDPTDTNAVTQQFQSNLDAVISGYGLQNADADTTTTVLSHTLDRVGIANGHATLFSEIPGYLPADQAATITPIINFLASPASGIIMGSLGPFISPWIALMNSITDGDDLNTTLANMMGAFFNGADLSLNSLLPVINEQGLFPGDMSMSNLDIAFGGLFSPGGVGTNSAGVGGSIFNSVGINFINVPSIGTLNAPSQAIGPIGAWEGWAQIVATLIGWDGSGSPLADTTLPIVPADFLDGATSSAAAGADLSGLLQDILSGFGL